MGPPLLLRMGRKEQPHRAKHAQRQVKLHRRLTFSLTKTTFLKQVTVSAIGRNLFLGTPEKNNLVDPESTNLGNDLNSEFGETGGTISTRNFGFGLKVVF